MISYEEYKGNKMIVIKKTDADRFPFKFGKSKAQLIVDNFEAIKKFAEGEEVEEAAE